MPLFRRLANREYLIPAGGLEERKVLLGLADVLFAYAYDHRTTGGEPTVESGWTVAVLSPLLSWLEARIPSYYFGFVFEIYSSSLACGFMCMVENLVADHPGQPQDFILFVLQITMTPFREGGVDGFLQTECFVLVQYLRQSESMAEFGFTKR